MIITSRTLHTHMSLCPGEGSPRQDERLRRLPETLLQISESLDLPVVLARVAREASDLFGGVCQVRFTPPHRPADARRVVSGPGQAPVACPGAAAELYAALLARLPAQEPARTGLAGCAQAPAGRAGAGRGEGCAEGGAALLLAPLVARGQRIGTLDVVVPAGDDAHILCDQRLLRTLAAHAALAIDTADQLARRAPPAEAASAPAPALDPRPLLAMVAHDLRGPLATLSSSIQLLVRTLKGPWELDAARVTRLAELAEAAITQVEIQVGALIPAPTAGAACGERPGAPVDLVRLARLMAHFYQQTTSRHQLTVCADAPALAVPWARPHAERVLGNLLVNAIKYSPGGGEIQIGVGREGDGPGGWAALRVQSPGIGIPPQDLAQVGQPGYRARNVGAIPGTGFGLASVREVVEQYGGSLAIQSRLGATTTVLIRMPLAEAPSAGEQACAERD